jgi:hypothetical protein
MSEHTIHAFLRGVLAVCDAGVVLESQLEPIILVVESTAVRPIALRLVEVLEEIILPCGEQSQ